MKNVLKVSAIISNALEEERIKYRNTHPISLKLFNNACKVFPGGNTRSSLYWKPFPLTIQKGIGCSLWDVDGHKYIDFLGDFTAGLFGHTCKSSA